MHWGSARTESSGAIGGAIEEGRQAQIARMRPNFQAIGGGDGVLQLGAQRPGASAIGMPPGAQPYNQLPGATPLLTPVAAHAGRADCGCSVRRGNACTTVDSPQLSQRWCRSTSHKSANSIKLRNGHRRQGLRGLHAKSPMGLQAALKRLRHQRRRSRDEVIDQPTCGSAANIGTWQRAIPSRSVRPRPAARRAKKLSRH